MKTFWYGSNNDGNVQFAHNETSLKDKGINSPQSFSVTGEVSGLNLIDEDQNVQSNQTQSQTA